MRTAGADTSDLDARAIGRGAGVAAAIALPAAIIQNLVAEGSSLRGLLFLVIAAAFGVGGWVAGRARPDRALTHGGLAGLAGYLGVLAITILIRLARGAGPALAGIPLALLIALSCGLLGGYVAFRRGANDEVHP
jgi:putative membrane protein (TIGR04086 family)